jgi:hypothetical protein
VRPKTIASRSRMDHRSTFYIIRLEDTPDFFIKVSRNIPYDDFSSLEFSGVRKLEISCAGTRVTTI